MSKVRVAATRCADLPGGKRLDKDVIAHKGVRMFRQLAIATAAALVITGVTVTPSMASPHRPPAAASTQSVYTAPWTPPGSSLSTSASTGTTSSSTPSVRTSAVDAQVILNGEQAKQLAQVGRRWRRRRHGCRPPMLQAVRASSACTAAPGGMLEEL